MEWYKDWFNSEEYLKVYRHRDQKEANELVQLVINNIDVSKVKNVLDMAAGSGRHAVIFAKKGFNVTAVDLSENLISIGKKNAENENVKIDFVHSDIRHFNPNIKYHLILNLFTSIGYFEKDEENYFILSKAYKLLKNNGHFVLDYFNKRFVENNLVPSTVDEFDGSVITQNRFIEGKRIIKEITIDNKGKINKYFESVRMFSKDELINMLQKLGFRIIKTFGDFMGNSFELESSPRIIIIACK
ncbi:MAG: class I SAM-dependent methyltransferase [Bacteroidetes bacterium]|nr:class I SAM-dependent methyltransferase [Bacteroidota bacterium]